MKAENWTEVAKVCEQIVKEFSPDNVKALY